LKIGDIGLTIYSSSILYDNVQCPTLYGIINIKFWLQYITTLPNLNPQQKSIK
jgi:hypothetical protein